MFCEYFLIDLYDNVFSDKHVNSIILRIRLEILALIPLIIACGKDKEQVDNPEPATKTLMVKIGEHNPDLPMHTIVDPQPYAADSNVVAYAVDLNDDNLDDLRIIHFIFQSSDPGNREEWIEIDYLSEVIVTKKPSTVTYSTNLAGDTALRASSHSALAPYEDTVWTEEKEDVYPMWFERGTELDLLDGSTKWSASYDARIPARGGLHLFYRWSWDQYYDGYRQDYGDMYYPLWKGTSHKYFVFSYWDYKTRRNIYGWVELSLSEALELKIHKIEYAEKAY